ncbi:LETM1 domain-containing protein [Heracleum sosnowskyi]|uniref:LETM1 domain-containing protein n=1 Tax=Heracleum sosnowskyi TaxID=360622 RepID=A0AAD8JI38_9APIA|nr:LETM1 domain-containing protein [Heracleum sosnowskyi]
MSIKLYNQSFVSSSSLNPWISQKPTRTNCFKKRVTGSDHEVWRGYLRKRCRIKVSLSADDVYSHKLKLVTFERRSLIFLKPARMKHMLSSASADDGVTVNGSSQPSTSSNVENLTMRLNQSSQGEDYNAGLVQTLHDAARVFELAIKEKSSKSKTSWFSTAWLGVDRNSWVKALSYQASVYSLLQSGCEISSRGDGRDRDINVFVQRSLLRQSAPLESEIREKMSAKQPDAYDWFWSEQVPAVVTSFVNYFEKDQSFTAATTVWGKGISLDAGNAIDKSLLILALSCIAAITKLGPAKVSCAQFFSIIPDTTGRLMDMLVEFIPIGIAYNTVEDIGLRREFLVHFGHRAASSRVKNDGRTEEVTFWVSLLQNQLLRAIDRERIWSKLTTSETIEVLDRDLAVFGFFIALGRSTQSFLYASGFEVLDEPIEGFIRHLIGGSVLYYPQLSSISSYQLYVEVVCEELDWIPFYPVSNEASRGSHGHKSKREGPPNAEAIPLVLEVCLHWIQSFIKYSTWLENPSNVKAAAFLSRGHKMLRGCMAELGIQKKEIIESAVKKSVTRIRSGRELDSFDKALESVEDAMIRLEELLQELHVSSDSSRKEHLKAACSDLERMRKLKKEAEFLEASFRAKAASLQEVDDLYYQDTFSMAVSESKSNEIQRFELLRNELMELEERVQKSADHSQNEEEEATMTDDTAGYTEGAGLIKAHKENIIEKSLDKLKETSTDVLQGTQLLAIDVAAASGLLRRVLIGDELTEKEKQALRRTLTDLASVVPIGFLMLLPVTAVGHAAMLAAIQRYVPGLIPSTYGAERLDLLRQLEKMKEMETTEVKPAENENE